MVKWKYDGILSCKIRYGETYSNASEEGGGEESLYPLNPLYPSNFRILSDLDDDVDDGDISPEEHGNQLGAPESRMRIRDFVV